MANGHIITGNSGIAGAIGWLALVLGTLPVLAHRRALLRHNEAVT